MPAKKKKKKPAKKRAKKATKAKGAKASSARGYAMVPLAEYDRLVHAAKR